MNTILNRKVRWTLLVALLVAAGPVCAWALASSRPSAFAYGCLQAKSGWMHLVDGKHGCKPDEVRVEFQSARSAEGNRG